MKEEKGEKGNGEKRVGGKTMAKGGRSVSLFQFLREKSVLQSIMAEYEAKKAIQSKLTMA